MRVLLVGLGPVGCVMGHHLQRGGAEVGALVKPAHASATRFRMRRLPRRAPPERFEVGSVHTSLHTLDPTAWDLVLLCVGSPALRRGRWLAELVEHLPDAAIVGLQPGLDDATEVAALAGGERTAWGTVSFVAYEAPLAGEALDAPEVAFWLPPASRMPFSGADARVDALIATAARGGLPARRVRDASSLASLASPPLNLHMAALERAGWRLEQLGADRALLRLTARATRQALAAVAASRRRRVPWWGRLPFDRLAPLLARLVPRVLPFPVQPYLQAHFSKVGDQTREQIDRWTVTAEAHGLPSDALQALGRALEAPGSPVASARSPR